MTDGRPALITGGAGFIATNLAERLLHHGRDVILYDNLSRAGVSANASALIERYGRGRVRLHVADIRDERRLDQALNDVSDVYHFAAQVAVTSSLNRPRDDFEVNALGTLTLLELLRTRRTPPSLIFTSTNKVYGELEDLQLHRTGGRYVPEDADIRTHGIPETRQLAFHSPYGCSKGAADQYVLDYARTFGIPAVVFRMSCIYGPHQFGTADQGWVAHFLFQSLAGESLTVYGDGCQVRDVLFVDDLVDAVVGAQQRVDELSGRAFNIGGGPERSISLIELIDEIEALTGRRPAVHFAPWRRADQRYYVSDIRAFSSAANWCPKLSLRDGLARLHHWVSHLPRHRAEDPRVAAAL
jgi:CDP-paratose 2-epimerase